MSRSGNPRLMPMRLYCANCFAESSVTPAGYGAQTAGGASSMLSKSRQATWISLSEGSGATSLSASCGAFAVSSQRPLKPVQAPFDGPYGVSPLLAPAATATASFPACHLRPPVVMGLLAAAARPHSPCAPCHLEPACHFATSFFCPFTTNGAGSAALKRAAECHYRRRERRTLAPPRRPRKRGGRGCRRATP